MISATDPRTRMALPQRITAAEYRALQQATATAPVKVSKYRNVVTVHGGRKYHSKAEAEAAAQLDSLQAQGRITGWVPQCPRFPLVIGADGRTKTYTADFLIFLPDGQALIADIKGKDTSESKLRRALVRERFGVTVLTDWRAVLAMISQQQGAL